MKRGKKKKKLRGNRSDRYGRGRGVREEEKMHALFGFM